MFANLHKYYNLKLIIFPFKKILCITWSCKIFHLVCKSHNLFKILVGTLIFQNYKKIYVCFLSHPVCYVMSRQYISCEKKNYNSIKKHNVTTSAWSQLDSFLGVAPGVWSAVWSQRRFRLEGGWDAAAPLTTFSSPALAFSASCCLISLWKYLNNHWVSLKHFQYIFISLG